MRIETALRGVALALVAAACLALAARPADAGERYSPEAPAFSALFHAFNDSYKQALFATSQGDAERSSSELAATRLAWRMLLATYQDSPPRQFRRDRRWRTDLATISAYLDIAGVWLAEGKLKDAHDTLEPIRRVWLQIHDRNQVRWFGGELTRFHDAMEPTVLFALAGVDDGSIAQFEGKLTALSRAWEKVQQFRFRPASEGDRREFQEMMGAETQAIANLRAAASVRDYESLGPLAQSVKDAFAALYLRFG